MPNLYYVKSGGTATGDAGRVAGPTPTYRTGSFATMGASAYYSDLYDILVTGTPTTAPVAGDIILFSDAHDAQYGSSTTFSGYPTYSGTTENLLLISVSDTNADQYSAGADESCSGTNFDITIAPRGMVIKGLQFSATDDLILSNMHCHECTFNNTQSNTDDIKWTSQSENFYYNCTFNGHTSLPSFDNGVRCKFYGGSWTFSGTPAGFFSGGGSYDTGGCDVYFKGFDLSDVGEYLHGTGLGNSDAEGNIIRYENCILPTLTAVVQDVPAMDTTFVELIGCETTAATTSIEHQYELYTKAGDVQDNTSVYRNESVAWPESSNKVSLHVDTSTNAVCAPSTPLIFRLPSRYCEFDIAGEDTITIYLACSTTLKDTDVQVMVLAKEDVDYENWTEYTTAAFVGDVFSAGNALTTDTGSTWTAPGTEADNKYRIEIDTTAFDATNNAAPCVPLILVAVTKQANIYFDTQVDLS